MPNEDLLCEIAARACCEAVQETSPQLAGNIARKLATALATQSLERERTKPLRDAVVLIVATRTQTETLEALLAATSTIVPGCGLLVMRGTQATGWSCHGLTTVERFRQSSLDCTRGVAATVINSCSAAAAPVSELDPVFASRLGLESSAKVLLVPVLLRGRVSALLVAVSRQTADLAALELLVQVAQLVLDLQAYRKVSPQTAAEPRQTVASHSADEASAPEPESVAQAATPSSTAITSSSAAQDAAAAPSSSAPPALDDMHEKARRFAKLLVEEISLYNHTKVIEGRARGDLYSRLREEIEKSRAAYEKRYGDSVSDVDYFTQELIRILADNDPVALGTGFPG